MLMCVSPTPNYSVQIYALLTFLLTFLMAKSFILVNEAVRTRDIQYLHTDFDMYSEVLADQN